MMFYILPSLQIKFQSGLVDFYFIYCSKTYSEATEWVSEQNRLLR